MARTEREKRLLLALGATVVVAAMLVLVVSVFAGGSNDGKPSASGAPKATVPLARTQAQAALGALPGPAGVQGCRSVQAAGEHGVVRLQQAAEPAPAASPEVPAGPSSAVVGGNTVTLQEIFEKNGKKKAHVDIDGTVYTAAAGDNFYDDYVLMSFNDPCAQFAWRDQSFRLCVQPGSGG
jgi:hypothetical protein